jgi:hypothetical protein
MASSLFQWLFLSMVSSVHPFFISMTDINHNPTHKSLEVSVRIYSDDFEQALRKNCRCTVEIMKPADQSAMSKTVSSYIVNHLQIKVDGQPASLQFAGYQQEEGSTWSYFEVKNVPSFKKLEVNNSLLYDYKEEQVNMVHLKAYGKEKSDKVDYPERNLVFTF